MESDIRTGPCLTATVIAVVLCLFATSVAAETYRWKDKNGKVHYGAIVPAEYADQPYDILNNAGLVVEHVEPATTPQVEITVEDVVNKREPLISEEERQRQTDRLLVVQYKSEDDIKTARDLEIAQLGYDSKLIKQSQASTEASIREQVKLVADQQRANIKIKEEQEQNLDKLYTRRVNDQKKLAAVEKRVYRIRTRFQAILERYRFLTTKKDNFNEEQTNQG